MEEMKPIFDGIAKVGERLASLNARRELLQAERARVYQLPLARDALEAELLAWIDQAGAHYRKRLANFVAPLSARSDRPVTRTAVSPSMMLSHDGEINPFDFVVGLLAESVKAALQQAMADMPLDDAAGLSREQRADALADLDRQIEAVESEMNGIRDQLAQAGIGREPVLPTLAQIREAFVGGLPSGPNYDRGVKELFRRLNPGLGERAADSKRPD